MNDDDVFDNWLNQANEELIASTSDIIDVDNVLATIKYRAATDAPGESADRAAEVPERIRDRVLALSIIRYRHETKKVIFAIRAALVRIFQSKGFAAVMAATAVTAVFVVLLSPLPGYDSPLLSLPASADREAEIEAHGSAGDADRPAQTGPGTGPDQGQVVPPVVQLTSNRAEPGELPPGQPASAEHPAGHRTPGEPTHRYRVAGEPAPEEPPEQRVPATSTPVTPDVQNEETVELGTQTDHKSVEIDSWQPVGNESDDLYIDQDGIYTALGARLSVIDGSQDPTYHDCAQRSNWVNRVNFELLQEGSRVCAQSRTGRYAVLTVIALPTPTGDGDRLVFHGRTWQLNGQASPDPPTPRQTPAPEPTSADPPAYLRIPDSPG